jgi:hypothetical protein
MRRLVLASFIAVALSLAGPSFAGAQTQGTSTPFTAVGTAGSTQGVVKVSVAIRRFHATAAGTRASGTATATLTPLGGRPTSVSKNVTLAVSHSSKCTILALTLETLELKLLGLDVHLEKVVLTITGEPHGGVLGSLFCSLAHAKVKAARKATVSRLNASLRHHGALHVMGVSAAVRAHTAATTPTCPVLDLVLGPLHLNLLGLVVDLNQVHLTIVAEPNGGILGSLFCGLANTKI